MGIYLGALFLSVCFSLFYTRGEEGQVSVRFHNGKIIIRKQVVYAILAFIPLAVIAGIRYKVGTDWSGTYINIFNIIKNGKSIRDVGYGALNHFVLLFTDKYTGIIFFTAILNGAFVYLAIFQQSDNPSLSIILYVLTCQYFFSLNGIRQALATAIFMYAMKYIVERDWKHYFFWIVIAASIHTTALLYIPLYFYKVIIKYYKQVLICLLVLPFGLKYVADIVMSIFYRINFLRNYFAWYFTSQHNTGEGGEVIRAIQITILVFMLCIYWRNRNDTKSQLFIVIQTVCVAVLIISRVMPMMRRANYLFSFANIIYLPNYIKKIGNKKIEVIVSIMIITCFFVYMWITTAIWNYNGVLPYQTIFS